MKRKSHVSMEKSQISRSIPEEILVKILCPLPLESLHRFKWVSKSWRSLITSEIFPKTLTPQFIGFIYRHLGGPFDYINTTSGDDDDGVGDTAIDPNLSFLPLNHYGFLILDCCNGLVLSRYATRNAPTYVVCNPFTKSWTRLSLNDYIPCHNLIDFDPSISPHYKVVAVWDHGNRVFIKVYRSETGRWEQKRRINLGDCISVDCRACALWDGDLYVQAYRNVGTLRNGSLRGGYVTLSFGLSGGDDDFELIMFPMGIEKPHRKMHIGRLWDGKLCFTDLDGLRLRVWTLRGKHEKEWVLEHESTISGLSGGYLGLPPVVVGFHPAREAVLIQFNHVIFAYDLQEMSLVEIFWIGKDGEAFNNVSLFPFLPCSYDFLESRNA